MFQSSTLATTPRRLSSLIVRTHCITLKKQWIVLCIAWYLASGIYLRRVTKCKCTLAQSAGAEGCSPLLQRGKNPQRMAHSGWAVEYADCTSTEGLDLPNEWPSWVGLYNTPTAPLQRCKTSPTNGPVGWGCTIHRLHLYRGVRPPQRMAQSGGAVQYTDSTSTEG